MNQIAIGKQLAFLSGTVLFLMTVVGAVGVVSVRSIGGNLEQIGASALPRITHALSMDSAAAEYRGNAWKHIISDTASEKKILDEENAQLRNRMEQGFAAYERLASSPEERAALDRGRQAWRDYRAAWLQVSKLSTELKMQEAKSEYVAKVHPRYLDLRRALKDLVATTEQEAREQMAAANDSASHARLLSFALTALCLLVGIGGSAWLIRRLNGQLNAIVAELTAGALEVRQAASQLAQSSQSLAKDSSDQAASLEETSASSEEVRSMSARNAAAAQEVSTAIERTRTALDSTTRSVEETVEAMHSIVSQSEEIRKINRAVDEIAFQTNILALNAAVEAARAGQAGLGFAVVADEVRNLAQRAAQAARETASLIDAAVDRAHGGQSRVLQVSQHLRVLDTESQSVRGNVSAISAASREQQQGIEQISRAIVQMERTTQRSAAASEEGAAAAEELSAQADSLAALVRRLEAVVHGGEAVTPGRV